jgi:hypothetical protein
MSSSVTRFLERVFRLPPEKSVWAAAIELMAYSNRPIEPEPDLERLDTKIKQLLQINT